jgi:hypothetical protein
MSITAICSPGEMQEAIRWPWPSPGDADRHAALGGQLLNETGFVIDHDERHLHRYAVAFFVV